MRIAITGCAGRMGRMLADAVVAADGLTLAGGSERPGHPAIGTDLGTLIGRAPLGAAVTADPAALFARCDVVIDFTTPAATAHHAGLAADAGVALVAGTTGLDA